MAMGVDMSPLLLRVKSAALGVTRTVLKPASRIIAPMVAMGVPSG